MGRSAVSSTSYYWVRNDAIKQHPDVLQHNRTPGWGLHVFYETDDEITSRGAQRFDSLKYDLSFKEIEVGKDRTDFVYFNPSIFTCATQTYEVFSDLIGDQCVCFPLGIGSEPYIAFRPKEHFDIVDRANTVCSVSSSGALYNFKKLSIISPPRKHIDFFGVTNANEISTMQIVVSESFKRVYDKNRMTGLQFLLALRVN